LNGWAFSPDSTATARRKQDEINDRASEIRAWNETQPLDKRMPESGIKLISISPTAFAQWSKKSQGLDAVTSFKERRDYAIENPLASRVSSGEKKISSALTGERYFQTVAKRAVEASGGNVNKAAESILNNPTTKDLFSQGMSESHLNAAAQAWRAKNGEPDSDTSTRSVPTRKSGAITGLSAGKDGPSQQQRDWDEAAAALRARGISNPDEQIGPRPAR
jgi:hypothetical protein